MINRIFFISAFIPRSSLPEENIYFSIRTDVSTVGALDQVYSEMEEQTAVRPPLALTLNILAVPDAAAIRSITSFLFIPSYIRIDQRPVLLLTGGSENLLSNCATLLTDYCISQGISDPVIHCLCAGSAGERWSFDSPDRLREHYGELLRSDRCYDNDLFYYASSNEDLQTALSYLRQEEEGLRQRAPELFALLRSNDQMKKELNALHRKQAATDAELGYQREYLAILRSGHATREIQDYYTREYEILPLWYKQLGHLIKVLTGKRTFRSLFRDDVKKYKV